jgi:hypothetical protein
MTSIYVVEFAPQVRAESKDADPVTAGTRQGVAAPTRWHPHHEFFAYVI